MIGPGDRKQSLNESASPNSKYLLAGTGRGTGGPKFGGSERGIVASPYPSRGIPSGRYDLGKRGSRKM